MPILQTERLELIPFSLDLIKLLVSDRTAFAARIEAQLLPDWPADYLMRLFRKLAEANNQNPALVDWGGYLATLKAERILVGYPGLKGPPDRSGAVEVGYSIAPAYQRQGLAPEAVGALISWAFCQPKVKRVKAECHEDNYASQRVLEKLGFKLVGKEGRMLRWVLTQSRHAPSATLPYPPALPLPLVLAAFGCWGGGR